MFSLIIWAPAWLAGLAATGMRWRPAASAFFKPQGAVSGVAG